MKSKEFGNGARFTWAGVGFAAIALSGCGTPASSTQGTSPSQVSSTPSDSAATTPAAATRRAVDVCALVTEQEASAALGGSTGPGTPRGSGDNKGCEYTKSGAGFLQVGTNPNQTRAEFDSAKSKIESASDVPDATVVEMPGLGDANFVSSSPHGGGCYVLKGAILGHLTLISPTAMAAPAETMKTLCSAMGGRL
ncbi:MAG: hypothetical protein NVS3B24_01640 [Candidatus Dormibacteria bacterium]